MAQNINQPLLGLNTDSTTTQVKPGELRYALNAVVESFDGNQVTYSNEQGNELCIVFPQGYKVIGIKNIVELDKILYFLTNPNTGLSQIGYSDNGECVYNILIDDKDNQSDKLNFNINHPIHKVVTKITNCDKHFYWTDGLNPRRYINLEDLPWKERKNPNDDYRPIKLTGLLDANKLLVQPNFQIPKLTPQIVDNGGVLKMGTYQFTIAYSNAFGETYTSYYNVTNPISIFEQKPGQFFDLPTSKSITVQIENLDTSGIYDYFTLAVVETINNISTPKVIGTFPINRDTFTYTYTGVETSLINLDMTEIFEKYPYYEIADDVFKVDNLIGWSNLKADERINYQQIWSKVKLYWETYQLPYNQNEGYSNGLNSALYRGYMRDEVYAFEGCFILKNGRQTDAFHIPGRIAKESDRWSVSPEDINNGIQENNCEQPEGKEFWQVYNTATKEGYSEEYLQAEDKDCYIGPYEWGEFAYWESTEKYPNNPKVWGDLANKKIRHHKFPDSTNSTHIHNNNTSGDRGFEHKIYPIGIKIDAVSLQEAIENSDLTREQKDNIVGFKILRGNRATNKSVIAKGLLNNVGKYKYEDEPERYYANYPYNDVRPDPYFSKEDLSKGLHVDPAIAASSGRSLAYLQILQRNRKSRSEAARLNGFGEHSKNRFVFHSPDTHFYNPSISADGSFLKMEGVLSGISYGHFQEVKDNPEYKFLTYKAYKAARGIAQASGIDIGTGTFGSPSFSVEAILPTYTNSLELFEKISPYTNFGQAFHSYGLYNNFRSLPQKERFISNLQHVKYVREGYEMVESGNVLNNKNRESSVYIKTSLPFKFTHEYYPEVQDKSRYTSSSYATFDPLSLGVFVRSFYAAGSPHKDGDVAQQLEICPTYEKYELYQFISTDASISVTYNDKLTVGSEVFTVFDFAYVRESRNNPSAERRTIIWAIPDNSVFPELPETGTFTLDKSYTYNSAIPTNYIDCYKIRGANRGAYSARSRFKDTLSQITNSEILNIYYYQQVIDVDTAFQWMAADFIYSKYEELYDRDDLVLNSERTANISCYYGAIKRELKNQWGRIYSYETIDTGFYHKIKDENNHWYKKYPTIFGGDIYINRFALKQKMSIFTNTNVGSENNADIDYAKMGSLGYPMFWISTKPIDYKIDLDKQIEAVINQVDPGENNKTFSDKIKDFLNIFGNVLTGGAMGVAIVMNLLVSLFNQIASSLGVKNINLDDQRTEGLIELGHMYLFSYGIPYYFCESEVNVDHRQALNDSYGNFYPNVSGGIPDDWLQEANTPIIHDNYYNYNQTYSKQNKENYFSHLREDWDPTKKCYTEFPNRAIWSDKSSLEENKNNWLLYRPSSYFDFEKTNGPLTSIDNIQNNQLLVRFHNKTQIYNALTTIEVSQGPQAYLGNSRLFSGTPPLDVSETDLGYAGSQHKALLRTENGPVFTDSKRGQVILLRGDGVEDLATKNMEKWFDEHLYFYIKDSFPEINIDNHFKDIGLHMVYDTFYNRLILTKLDYKPIQDITYKFNRFYNKNNQEVHLTDKNYFCNKSWTISYSFRTQSWTSWHSYRPNYYIGNNNYFQSGEQGKLYTHNTDYTKYTTYYDKKYPYILEYPFAYKTQDEILQSIKEYATAKQYTNWDTWIDKDETIYFNKAIIYNSQQCSGIRNLIPKPKNSLAAYSKYPIFNTNSTDILLTKNDNLFSYNQFWNILKDTSKPIFTTTCEWDIENKDLNEENLDYTQRNYRKQQIRAKDTYIRHILDNRHDTKLSSIFILTETQPSYK